MTSPFQRFRCVGLMLFGRVSNLFFDCLCRPFSDGTQSDAGLDT